MFIFQLQLFFSNFDTRISYFLKGSSVLHVEWMHIIFLLLWLCFLFISVYCTTCRSTSICFWYVFYFQLWWYVVPTFPFRNCMHMSRCFLSLFPQFFFCINFFFYIWVPICFSAFRLIQLGLSPPFTFYLYSYIWVKNISEEA